MDHNGIEYGRCRPSPEKAGSMLDGLDDICRMPERGRSFKRAVAAGTVMPLA
ncbi:hypothetical protein [Streptosporangium vulgare]|uniref:hypothetical protein n=1 Tax=Streptosporangium vulgare TaxID=46190 RepID=UPI0031DB9361